MSLGQRIRKSRLALRITQEQLAIPLGVTPQHISALEKDKADPSLDLLSRLAKELGVTVDYLLTGEEVAFLDPVVALKADKSLSLETRRALIVLVQALRQTAGGL